MPNESDEAEKADQAALDTAVVQVIEIEMENDWMKDHLSGPFACLLKRIIVIAPILIITVNTLNGIYNISTEIASQSAVFHQDIDIIFSFVTYNSWNEVQANTKLPSTWNGCETAGGIKYLKGSCDFTKEAPFISMISIWCVWCFLMAVASLIYTASYSPNDFRFFVAVEAFRSTMTNHILCICGFLLTIVTALVGLFYAMQDDKVGNDFFLALAIFTGLNFSALNRLFRRDFDIDMSEWEDEILVVPVKNEEKRFLNFYGAAVTSDTLLTKIGDSMICSMTGAGTKEDTSVKKYGNEKELKEAFTKIGPRKTAMSANLFS